MIQVDTILDVHTFVAAGVVVVVVAAAGVVVVLLYWMIELSVAVVYVMMML
jgi:hypothetical protein